jgi:hypothetical protein
MQVQFLAQQEHSSDPFKSDLHERSGQIEVRVDENVMPPKYRALLIGFRGRPLAINRSSWSTATKTVWALRLGPDYALCPPKWE